MTSFGNNITSQDGSSDNDAVARICSAHDSDAAVRENWTTQTISFVNKVFNRINTPVEEHRQLPAVQNVDMKSDEIASKITWRGLREESSSIQSLLQEIDDNIESVGELLVQFTMLISKFAILS